MTATEGSKAPCGASGSCEGCPNQKICADSTTKGPDPDIHNIAVRLQNVRNKIMILSGKGGVGKSTFSAQLSFFLAAEKKKKRKSSSSDDQYDNDDEDDDSGKAYNVGLLDIDICGPSIPRIMNLRGAELHPSNNGWQPVYVEENLGVISVGFMLADEDEAVIWRGAKKNGLIKKFLRDVDWGDLDYLIIDTPPGTSDEHLSTVTFLKESGVDGAVIVTTPQEVSLVDVRKEINFVKKMGIPILGVVENMAGFVCPSCKNMSDIFPADTGGAEKMSKEMGVPYLGKLPLDPLLARACDDGGFIEEYATRSPPVVMCFRSVIANMQANLALSKEK